MNDVNDLISESFIRKNIYNLKLKISHYEKDNNEI
jgi:hypothetical protein